MPDHLPPGPSVTPTDFPPGRWHGRWTWLDPHAAADGSGPTSDSDAAVADGFRRTTT